MLLRGCFPALVKRQAVEGHRSRMREAVWVALWSDIKKQKKSENALVWGRLHLYDLYRTGRYVDILDLGGR